jgi:hypothetical protein
LLFSQAVDRLYLSVSATGRVYDVTGVPATFPAPLATPNYSGSTPERISNLAVGYDTPAGNPTGLVLFIPILQLEVQYIKILFLQVRVFLQQVHLLVV